MTEEVRRNAVAARTALEIEAGRKRLAQLRTTGAPARVSEEPAPVTSTEPGTDAVTTLVIPGVTENPAPGVADYVAGQNLEVLPGFATVISDEPTEPALPVAAAEEPAAPVEPVAEPKIWTADELHEIATHGIKALREIATPLGVKGIAKEEIIREILALQGGEGAEIPAETVPGGDVDLDATLDDLLNS